MPLLPRPVLRLPVGRVRVVEELKRVHEGCSVIRRVEVGILHGGHHVFSRVTKPKPVHGVRLVRPDQSVALQVYVAYGVGVGVNVGEDLGVGARVDLGVDRSGCR